MKIVYGVLAIGLFSFLIFPMSGEGFPSLLEFVVFFGGNVLNISILLIVLWVAFGVLDIKKSRDIESAYGSGWTYDDENATYRSANDGTTE